MGLTLLSLLTLLTLFTVSVSGSLKASDLPIRNPNIDVIFYAPTTNYNIFSVRPITNFLYSVGRGLLNNNTFSVPVDSSVRLSVLCNPTCATPTLKWYNGTVDPNTAIPNSANAIGFFSALQNIQFASDWSQSSVSQQFQFAENLFLGPSDSNFPGPRKQYFVIITDQTFPAEADRLFAQSAARALKFKGVTIVMIQGNSNPSFDSDTLRRQVHDVETLASSPLTGNSFVIANYGLWAYLSDYAAPLVSRLRGDLGFKCAAFGAGHFSTFDGNYYNFQGLGDFVLFQSLDAINTRITVEVRKGLCSSAYAPSSQKRVTCNRALAIAYGSTVFNFFVEGAGVGTLPSVSVLMGSTNNDFPTNIYTIVDFKNNGYGYVAIRDNTYLVQYKPQNGGTGTFLTEFYLELSNEGISISFRPDAALNSRTSGLCGLYDGDPLNDFTNARNELIPSGKPDSELDGLFGSTFRSNPADSIFLQRSEISGSFFAVGEARTEYNPVKSKWSGDYGTGGAGSCDNIPPSSSGVTGSYLRDSCNTDTGSGQPSNSAERMFFSLCHEYCELGLASSGLITAQDCEDNVCTHRDSETRLYLHQSYNTTSLPPYQLTNNPNDPRILFRPTINVGGQYNLRLTVTDNCGYDYQNLSINVICPQNFEPSVTILAGANKYDKDLRSSQVILRADVSGSKLPLAYSWQLVSAPPALSNPDIRPNSVSRTISLGHGISGYGFDLINNNLVPGNYTIELAVTDGCSIVRKQFNFTSRCSNCMPVSFPYGTTVTQSFFVNTGFQQSVINMRSADYDGPQPSVDASLSEDPTSPYQFKRIDSTTGLHKVYIRYIPETTSTSITDPVTTRNVYNSSTPPSLPLSGPPLIGYIDNSLATESFYFAQASDYNNTEVINTTTTVVTTITKTQSVTLCTYNVDITKQNLVVDGYTNTVSKITVTPFSVSSNWWDVQKCLGSFWLTYTAYDECWTHNSTDKLLIEVTCSKPVARLKCHDNTLDYTGGRYPNIHFDSRDSYDTVNGSYIPYLLFTYEGLDNVICGNSPIPCVLASAVGLSYFDWNPNTGPVTPHGGGVGVVRLTVTNGCQNDSDTVSLKLLCPDATAAQPHIFPFDGDISVSFTYSPSPLAINSDFSAIQSVTPAGFSSVYTWTITPAPLTIPLLPVSDPTRTLYYTLATLPSSSSLAPTVNPTSGQNTSLNFFFEGVHSLTLSQDIGCNVFQKQVKLTISCQNAIIILTPSTLTLTYGGPQLVIDGGATSTPGTPSPDLYRRYYALPSSLPEGILSATFNSPNLTIATQSLGSPTGPLYPSFLNGSLWVYDGNCAWQYKTFNISLVCPDKIPFELHYSRVTIPYTGANSSPLGTAFLIEYTGGLPPFVSQSGGFKAKVTPPVNSAISSNFFTANQTYIPDVSGTYIIEMWFNDGCGDDYIRRTVNEFVQCPDFISTPVILTDPSTTSSIAFDDKQTVRMYIQSPSYLNGFGSSFINTLWSVSSAPYSSVYYVIDPPQTTQFSSVSYTNTTVDVNSTFTTISTSTIVSNSTYKTQRRIYLTRTTDFVDGVWPTCFRPDIGGSYIVKFTATLSNTQCPVEVIRNITVQCPTPPVIPSSLSDWSVSVARDQPTRVWLNADGVTASVANESITYNWQIVYPNSSSVSSVDGTPLTPPTIISYRSKLASFFVPRANIDYRVKLSVSDGCSTTEKIVTIKTPCSIDIQLQNKTLSTTYDGEIPVTLMSFAYDHTQTVSSYLEYPKCQLYSWKLIDYSVAVSSSLIVSGGTEFTKTSGFAGLISVVVIVAVVVPVIIWMYFTKKACFKQDPRV